MNAKRQILASVGIAAFCAAASFGQQVKTDYDRNANFSQYKTYSWEKVQTQDSLWVDRIKEAVNAALTAKGLTPVESGGDIAIVAVESTQGKTLIWRGSSSDTLTNPTRTSRISTRACRRCSVVFLRT
jgi:hypothetical protein